MLVAEFSARSGPGIRYERKWYLDNRQPLVILDKKKKWLKASNWEGNEFWVHSRYLRTDVSCGLVKVDRANIRMAPSIKSSLHKPLRQLFRHDVFEILQRKGSWIKGQYDKDYTFWIYNSLVWPSEKNTSQ